MNSVSLCNIKVGNDSYYANEEDKYVINERSEMSITALVLGLLTLFYVLKKASEQLSFLLIVPFASGLFLVVMGSIQLKKYTDSINDVKGYGKNCRSS